MIAIIADNNSSISIEEVIDWLDSENKAWTRIIGTDYFLKDKTLNLSLNSENSDYCSYSSIWYRGFLRNRELSKVILKDLSSNNDSISELYRVIINEVGVLRNFILDDLGKAYLIPNPKSLTHNKLKILKIAQEKKLRIPDTIITNSKSELIKFHTKHLGNIITKPLYEVSHFFEEEGAYRYLTSKISEIEKLDDFFFPSLFQAQIEKDYEIRSFILEDEVYSMAIMSQNDEQTKVDFRNYNDERPNRFVPYKLPKVIEEKLLNLCEALKLNTGSADILKDKEGNYVFLEINPSGQFGMTSKPCNYYLEKKIAEKLK